MIGWQGGKPLSPHLYDARRNKPKGQRYAAKNDKIAKPLVPLQVTVHSFKLSQ
jgi:hypothetical protein